MGFLGAASPELEWPLIPWDRPKDQNLLPPAGGQLLPACPESVLGGQKKKSIPASASSCRKPLLFLFLADDHTGTTTETCPSFIHIVRCNKVRLRYVELSKVSSTTRRIIHLRKLITSIKCEIMIKFVQIARKI
jgi:hypothetical protein